MVNTMTDDRIPDDYGYFKISENSKGYFNITLPIAYVRKHKLTEGMYLHALEVPSDKALKLTPSRRPQKRRKPF